MSAVPPQLQIFLRKKECVALQPFVPGSAPAYSATGTSPDDVAVRPFNKEWDGSSYLSLVSKDGRLAAVGDKEGIDIYDLTGAGKPLAAASVAAGGGSGAGAAPSAGSPVLIARIAQPEVLAAHFSPLGDMLLTWHRKVVEEPNLQIWSTADGSLKAALHQRTYAAETWPPLKWTGDQALCARVAADEVQLFDGSWPAPPAGSAGVPSVGKIPSAGVQQVFVSPNPGPNYSFVTFSPRTKSRPGVAMVWSWPRPGAAEPTVSRSIQADACNVQFSPDGSLALIELSTEASRDSYYGDSRLFLVSRDGRVNIAIMPPKEGPTHDFAWGPASDWFIVIAGKSPPAATLYNKQGAPVFSFGAAAHNTVRVAPNGRVILLAGFGNMSGNMVFWDMAARKPLGPAASASCVVNAEWSPDSKFLLTATTRPRLQVDNGYAIWNYHGARVAFVSHDFLYQAQWRPAKKDLFPDRAPSPAPAAAGGTAAAGGGKGGAAGGAGAAAAAPKPAGAYRPPALRGAGGAGALMSEASAIMSGGYRAAGKVEKISADPPVLFQGVPQRVVLGSAPAEPEAPRKWGREPGGGGGGRKSAAGAPATAASTPAAAAASSSAVFLSAEEETRLKEGKKLAKKLKDIDALKAAAAAGRELDASQKVKMGTEEEVRKKLAEMGLSPSGLPL